MLTFGAVLLARAAAEGAKPMSRAATREAESWMTLKPFQPSLITPSGVGSRGCQGERET